jgi:hypothetical protein
MGNISSGFSHSMNVIPNHASLSQPSVTNINSGLFTDLPSHLRHTFSHLQSMSHDHSHVFAICLHLDIIEVRTETNSQNFDSERVTISSVVWSGIAIAIIVLVIITGLIVWFFASRSRQKEIEGIEDGPGFEIDDDRLNALESDSFSWIGNSAKIGPFWDDPMGLGPEFEFEEGHW